MDDRGDICWLHRDKTNNLNKCYDRGHGDDWDWDCSDMFADDQNVFFVIFVFNEI